jgi:transcriptional regulator with XRE-family HTH domain
MPKKAFGVFFKELRIAQQMTLRQFCDTHGYDPGNMSRLERGLLPPPDSEAKLTDYAKALRIRRGSDTWYEFFDLARMAQGKLPPEILKNRDVVERLPLLFRTLRGQRVSERKLNELVEMIRRS